MKWTQDRSSNVEDRRGRTSGGRDSLIGGGLGTIVIAAIIFFLGGDPSALLNSDGVSVNSNETTITQRDLTPEELHVREFVQMITYENEETWTKIFHENNMEYRPAKVVLFEGVTNSGCGTAQATMGPFYCPADETVYMDMSFFNELESKFGAKVTEFTIAYVMGHEMGHHVQNLLGVLNKTNQIRRSGQYSEVEMNAISVATELQADFYAGLWSRYTEDRERFLEPGDLEAAMSAAAAVGDDNIQRRSQGYVDQESFTHGSSEQRKYWFMKGYKTGDITKGDTFSELLK